MGDHDLRRPGLAPEIAHQVEDLRLDRHVQRRRGLVRDEKRWIVRQRHGDHHPLPHAARKLMRILVQTALRRGDPYPLEHLQRARPAGVPKDIAVRTDGFRDLVADLQRGIERSHRLLKDHRDAVPAQRAQRARRGRKEVRVLKHRRAALDPQRSALEQPHQREGRQAFAAAGFADDTERFPGLEREVHVLDKRPGGAGNAD